MFGRAFFRVLFSGSSGGRAVGLQATPLRSGRGLFAFQERMLDVLLKGSGLQALRRVGIFFARPGDLKGNRSYRMKRSVFIFISLLSGLLLASEKIEYRDAQGRLQGSARAQNGKVEYRDAQGRLQGSARAQNGKTEYRDAQGRFQGSAREVNGKTEYRDAQGRLQGSARKVNGKIEYRDAQGRLQGTAREVNGKMEYRDAQGRLHGSKRTR